MIGKPTSTFTAAITLAVAAAFCDSRGAAAGDRREPRSVPVLTRSYTNNRVGANVHENKLSPSAIAKGMRRLFSLVVTDDPRIEAQPLVVPDLLMNDGRVHNVVYVATMANHIYAFDADDGLPIWKHPSFLGPSFYPSEISRPIGHRRTAIDLWGVNIRWGIVSTPVIDIDQHAMYVVNWVAENGDRSLFLHEISLTDGHEMRSPVRVQATATGPDGSTIALVGNQLQRTALLLDPLVASKGVKTQKRLYIATSGGETQGAPHGWVLAYDVPSLHPLAAWTSTPSSFGGGIWQSGQGLSADDSGNVYAMTSSGGFTFDADGKPLDFTGTTDFPNAIVKLHLAIAANGTSKLDLVDWYAPFRSLTKSVLGKYTFPDKDLGTAGPILPDGTNLVLGVGKDGILYVLRRDRFGKSVGSSPGLVTPPVSISSDPNDSSAKMHNVRCSPVYWTSTALGPMLYVWGENESLRAYRFDVKTGTATLFGQSSEVASRALASDDDPSEGGMSGGLLTLSANAGSDGVVWATAPLDGDAGKDIVDGVLRAYDATHLDAAPNADGTPRLRLLWSSTMLDDVNFAFSKFTSPVVSGGKVFVPTYSGRVDVYGAR